jgi:hypothetical protein
MSVFACIAMSEEHVKFWLGQAGIGGHAAGQFVAEIDDH